MNNISVNIYSDLMNNSSQVNAYKIQDSFKYDSKNIEDINFLSNISVEEIELIRYSKDNDFGFDGQFAEIAIKNIIVPDKITIALIVDSEIKPVSKLRSYKGILDKKLKEQSEYLEKEIAIRDNQTIIGNLVVVTNENIKNILDNYFGNSNTCCFLLFGNDFNFQKDFLNNILKDCMIHTQTSVLNYFSLCKLLKQKEQIIRIGGDGYDEVSLQIFSLK